MQKRVAVIGLAVCIALSSMTGCSFFERRHGYDDKEYAVAIETKESRLEDGCYYGLDATWDAGREDWRYFLRGKDGFAGHTPGKPFNYNDLASQYTISETDWPCPDNLSAPEVVFG